MEPDISQILQEQLRDIHMPEAISWWPLAFGWWILIALFLAVLAIAIWQLLRYQQGNRYRKLALAELNNLYSNWQSSADTATYLQTANQILKRAVFQANVNSDTSSLSGHQWAEHLNSYTNQSLAEDSCKALAESIYMKEPDTNVEKLHLDLCTWLKTHRNNIGHREATNA